MLPLEGILFIPSLLVTPLAVAALLFFRKRATYPTVWRNAVITCLILTALYAALTLSAPLYSERDKGPDNPGGFSAGLWAVAGAFLFWTCVVIPSFPMLIALAFLPPTGRTRLPLVVFSILVVSVLIALIVRKNSAYVADYRREQSIPRQSTFDRFKHLRTDPAEGINGAE
jgi:hypothetical protein